MQASQQQPDPAPGAIDPSSSSPSSSQSTQRPPDPSHALSHPAPSLVPKDDAPQRLLILTGLVGSGKSTFTLSLCASRPSYVRSNQDTLGNRRNVIRHVRETIARGCNAVVDRTNVDREQRRHWVALAGEIQRETGRQLKVHAVVFDTPIEVCEARLKLRTDHETLSPDRALDVLRRFSSTFEPPSLDEGFDGIIYLRPSDIDGGGEAQGGGPSEGQLRAFLERLDEAERAADANGRWRRNAEIRSQAAEGLSSGAREGNRGRGRGRGGWRGPQQQQQPHQGSAGASYGAGYGRGGYELHRGRGRGSGHHSLPPRPPMHHPPQHQAYGAFSQPHDDHGRVYGGQGHGGAGASPQAGYQQGGWYAHGGGYQSQQGMQRGGWRGGPHRGWEGARGGAPQNAPGPGA